MIQLIRVLNLAQTGTENAQVVRYFTLAENRLHTLHTINLVSVATAMTLVSNGYHVRGYTSYQSDLSVLWVTIKSPEVLSLREGAPPVKKKQTFPTQLNLETKLLRDGCNIRDRT